jgi:hypothetical protein
LIVSLGAALFDFTLLEWSSSDSVVSPVILGDTTSCLELILWMCMVVSRFYVVTRDQGLRRLNSYTLILDFTMKDARSGNHSCTPLGSSRTHVPPTEIPTLMFLRNTDTSRLCTSSCLAQYAQQQTVKHTCSIRYYVDYPHVF